MSEAQRGREKSGRYRSTSEVRDAFFPKRGEAAREPLEPSHPEKTGRRLARDFLRDARTRLEGSGSHSRR